MLDRNTSGRGFRQLISTSSNIAERIDTGIFCCRQISKLECHATDILVRGHVLLGQLQIDLFRVRHINHDGFTANSEFTVMAVRLQIGIFIFICLCSKACLIDTVFAHGETELEVIGSQMISGKCLGTPVSDLFSVSLFIVPGFPLLFCLVVLFQCHGNTGQIDRAVVAVGDLFAVSRSGSSGQRHSGRSGCITDFLYLNKRICDRIVHDSEQIIANRIGCSGFGCVPETTFLIFRKRNGLICGLDKVQITIEPEFVPGCSRPLVNKDQIGRIRSHQITVPSRRADFANVYRDSIDLVVGMVRVSELFDNGSNINFPFSFSGSFRDFVLVQEFFIWFCFGSKDKLEGSALSQSNIGITIQSGSHPCNLFSTRERC